MNILSKICTEQVTFYSSRDELNGELHYLNGLSSKIPAIVFAHGYCNNRDELGGLRELAYFLCKRGYAILQFDQTGCGESTKTISRGKMFPIDWTRNISSAVSFLSSKEKIDSRRIGVLGTSMGGAVSCSASALDDRIKCAISLAGIGDGERWLRELWLNNRGKHGWHRFLSRLRSDRMNRSKTGISEYVTLPEILPFSGYDMELYKQIIQSFPQFVKELPMECVDDIFMFKPERSAYLISPRAICYIHGEKDTLVPACESQYLYDKTRDPRELHIISDAPHVLVDPSLDQNEEIYSIIDIFYKSYL